jgi:NAD(P)-dependent dehydrogenase (short-subunit alcohol dehydrogenase family)
MDLKLRGKVVVVTGGSSGIGLAAARELAAEGASVAVVARTAATLEAAARGIPGAVAVPADVSDGASVRAMVAEVVERLGRIDILVNCASPQVRQMGSLALADTRYEQLRADLETKVLGALRCSQAVAPHMIRQGWGRIVNVSGGAARNSSGTIASIRNVSLVALTKNLADELGPHGINVTVIHPGLVKTERRLAEFTAQAAARGISLSELEREGAANVAVRRWMTPEEIAYVITFLASPRSVAVSGDVLAVGGGSGRAIYY